MSNGYPFAALAAGVSSYIDLSALIPPWMAGLAAIHLTCAVLVIGILKFERQRSY